MREVRWRRTVAKATSALVAIVAAGALLGAPAAEATNGGETAFLPEKSDWCLGASEPVLTDVGTAHAFVRFEYWDECTLPASSSVEIRSADGSWHEVEAEHTKHSDLNDKSRKWTKRTVRLSGLRNNTRYFVRTRIDYVFDDAHTNEVTFRTGGDPAREMHAWGSLSAWPNEAKMSLSAIVPDTAKNIPVGIWVAHQGYEQFSDEVDWKEDQGKSSCAQLPDHYSKCTWPISWRLGTGEPRPLPPWWWRNGIDYRVRLCLKNTAYENEFGKQCTKEFTVVAGRATTIDVGQA
jgi:hypothetical protein